MQKVELLKQVAANPNIPSPPATVLRVLEKASTPDCTITELCKIIQMDPGLSGKVLRIVNSALFGLSRPATSIRRALAVLGVNSARLLVLAIALPEMNKNVKVGAQFMRRYWRLSISGAVVALELSQRLDTDDAEDDMAAGLLRDIGELVLLQVFPSGARGYVGHPEEPSEQSQCELEERHYGLHHAEVSAFILDRWRLPSEMTEAVRWHHHPKLGKFSTPRAERLAFELHFASRAAQLWLDANQTHILADLCVLARERFSMSEDDVLAFLSPLGRKATEMASLLDIDIGKAGEFSTALARAGEELVRLSLTASLEHQQAQEMSRRAESEAQRWRQEASFDPLTKLPNRRLFDRKLDELFHGALQNGTRFGLLFIDLDSFKPLNDRFGHAFGDLALQSVAQCLLRVVRQRDIVARIGGDEFCVLTESADESGAWSLGERMVDAINRLPLRQGEQQGRVSASIGAVCCKGSTPWQNPEELLAGADRAMYLAKSRGGNRVIFLKSLNDALAEPAPTKAKFVNAGRT